MQVFGVGHIAPGSPRCAAQLQFSCHSAVSWTSTSLAVPHHPCPLQLALEIVLLQHKSLVQDTVKHRGSVVSAPWVLQHSKHNFMGQILFVHSIREYRRKTLIVWFLHGCGKWGRSPRGWCDSSICVCRCVSRVPHPAPWWALLLEYTSAAPQICSCRLRYAGSLVSTHQQDDF